jgi:hypothetical protein
MALSAPRNTLTKGRDVLVVPVAAATVIHAGALVALNASGLGVPGSVATTLTAAGRAEESADNSAGAASAISVTVRRGVFLFKNHGADPVVQADLLKDCFIVDDETVAKTNGTNTRSKAGKVVEVETNGVWVEIA